MSSCDPPIPPRKNHGNTKHDSSKRPKEVKRYCFTFNNYTIEKVDKLTSTLNPLGNYCFGYEVGEKGTPHLQGYINLKNKKTLSALIHAVDIKEIHFEACKGTEKENIDYCTKDNNWVSNFVVKPEPLELIDSFDPWMVELIELCKLKACKRSVYWVWEPIGGVGKSSFCKYLCATYGATYIDEGKKSDLINIIYNLKEINSKSIIAIDIPRDNRNGVSYKAIEQIKNGMICNTKYETGMKLFNSPHLIVFCNYPPEFEKLSLDRWKVFEIIDKKLVKTEISTK